MTTFYPPKVTMEPPDNGASERTRLWENYVRWDFIPCDTPDKRAQRKRDRRNLFLQLAQDMWRRRQ